MEIEITSLWLELVCNILLYFSTFSAHFVEKNYIFWVLRLQPAGNATRSHSKYLTNGRRLRCSYFLVGGC